MDKSTKDRIESYLTVIDDTQKHKENMTLDEFTKGESPKIELTKTLISANALQKAFDLLGTERNDPDDVEYQELKKRIDVKIDEISIKLNKHLVSIETSLQAEKPDLASARKKIDDIYQILNIQKKINKAGNRIQRQFQRILAVEEKIDPTIKDQAIEIQRLARGHLARIATKNLKELTEANDLVELSLIETQFGQHPAGSVKDVLSQMIKEIKTHPTYDEKQKQEVILMAYKLTKSNVIGEKEQKLLSAFKEKTKIFEKSKSPIELMIAHLMRLFISLLPKTQQQKHGLFSKTKPTNASEAMTKFAGSLDGRRRVQPMQRKDKPHADGHKTNGSPKA